MKRFHNDDQIRNSKEKKYRDPIKLASQLNKKRVPNYLKKEGMKKLSFFSKKHIN